MLVKVVGVLGVEMIWTTAMASSVPSRCWYGNSTGLVREARVYPVSREEEGKGGGPRGPSFLFTGRKALNTVGREGLKATGIQEQQYCLPSRWMAPSTATGRKSNGHVIARLFRHLAAWPRSGAVAHRTSASSILPPFLPHSCLKTKDSSHQTNPPRSTRTRASSPFSLWYTFPFADSRPLIL